MKESDFTPLMDTLSQNADDKVSIAHALIGGLCNKGACEGFYPLSSSFRVYSRFCVRH